jgi:hypothetical protein
MASTNIVKAFNNHFTEFVEDIIRVFPDNVDVLSAKNAIAQIRKANPKLVPEIWKTLIVGKYMSKIENGDLDYFINKDYSEDLAVNPHNKVIIEAIDRMRKPLKDMNPDDKAKSIKYIQNLSKLSLLC